MRQLLPPTDVAVDAADPFPGARRARQDGRPWLLVNMVCTADGATAVGGVSGDLGGEADKAVFAALRRAADVVLAGAETARAEGYGPARPRPDGSPGPQIAIVTRSGRLDPTSRLFSGPPPIVFTCLACPPERRIALESVAEVVVVGDEGVDLRAALAALGDRGVGVVACEGGPTINGQLIAADLIDEWCLTIDPSLAGGPSKRASIAPEAPAGGPRSMQLDRLLESDGVVFARYLRQT